MTYNKTTIATLPLLLSLAVSGCDSNKDTSSKTEDISSESTVSSVASSLPSNTLASVNGTPITEDEVLFSIERNFDFTTQQTGGDALRKSVLDSLIAAEVIKQRAQSKLSKDTLEKISFQTATYESELYIKEYLSATVKPTPVTNEMVEAYYQANPGQFGGAEIKEFELLKTTKINETARDQFLAEAEAIKTSPDWKSVSKKWAEQLGLQYQVSNAKPGVLVSELDTILSQLTVGETSNPVLIKGHIHLLRVTNIRTIAAKSIIPFRTQIRESLAPMQLRDAIKKVSDQLLKEADITLIDTQG